ncbi:MAG: polyprenyl synthetase family protein [Bdellovibrionales bacterium]|nr:polyprenyl synthetase family protein [Bdellovibrionales bacterium]
MSSELLQGRAGHCSSEERPNSARAEGILPEPTRREADLGLLKEAARDAFLSGAAGLQLVEERVRSCLDSEAEVLSSISRYLLELGGKRIRPLLAVLLTKLFGISSYPKSLIDAAAGVELIHMATLLHDDIIDQSPTRRNHPSAFIKFGVSPTLLAGDFLLVKAFGLCAKLDPYIIQATERACIELTEGEVLEGTLADGRRLSLEQYVNIISKKTASLFQLAAGIGAFSAGVTPADLSRVEQFGRAAGLAFQIVDDILDVVADADLLGKPSGTDLKQKTPSLPNILWLESGDPRALEFFSIEQPNRAQCDSALEVLRSSDIIAQSRAVARQHADTAQAALHGLEADTLDLTVRDRLLSLVEYTLERCL